MRADRSHPILQLEPEPLEMTDIARNQHCSFSKSENRNQ